MEGDEGLGFTLNRECWLENDSIRDGHEELWGDVVGIMR